MISIQTVAEAFCKFESRLIDSFDVADQWTSYYFVKWLFNHIYRVIICLSDAGTLQGRLCPDWTIIEIYYQFKLSIDRLWMICTIQRCQLK